MIKDFIEKRNKQWIGITDTYMPEHSTVHPISVSETKVIIIILTLLKMKIQNNKVGDDYLPWILILLREVSDCFCIFIIPNDLVKLYL